LANPIRRENPFIASDLHPLAILNCVVEILGWQFQAPVLGTGFIKELSGF
jgi:hypothetical protein